MMALMTKAGIASREDRLHVARAILGEPLESFTVMTEEEIEQVASGLRAWELVQTERFTSGTLFIEAGMMAELLSDPAKLSLSDRSILPDSTSRKAFMSAHPQLDVSEQNYAASTADFDTVLSQIAAATDTKAQRLTISEGRWEKWRTIPAPTVSMGLALGVGGMPRGKIVHLWGRKHAGKSMMANCLIAQAQSQGIPCVLLDAEAAATGDFLGDLGVDIEDLSVIRPPDLETLCSLLRSLAKTGALIVVDSIAASASSVELERNLKKDAPRVGGNALLWTSTLGIIRKDLLDSGGTVVLINQVRSKIGASQYEEDEKPYGSEGIQHNSDISIKVTPVREKNETLRKNGYANSKLRFDKNRFAGNTPPLSLPFRPGFPYNRGLDLVRTAGDFIYPGVETTYGEMSGGAILAKTLADDNGELVEKANRWTILVDPTMMAAIRADEPDFDAVEVEPVEEFDPDSIPPLDAENGVYFTLPRVGELAATKWIQAHPTAREVIIERMLDGLDSRRALIGEV